MIPPCVEMTEKVLPEVRRRTARILKDKGLGQNEIAAGLQVTQAMVSKYMNASPRSFGQEIDRAVQAMAEELAEGILAGRSRAELTEAFCRACFRMRESGAFCSLHTIEDCRLCMNIRGIEEAGDRADAIRDVQAAVRMIERIHPDMIPEVRVNIARAVEGAQGINDVVAIPGRMVEIKGRLMALTRPEFGASRHLSETLLDVMKEREGTRAVINILFSDEIERAMERTGVEEDVIIDRGAFGREPCAYVLGRSATDAAAKVMRISEEMG